MCGEVWYAPFDVILSDTSIVQPDIIYAEQSRLGALSQRGLEGPPTLAVEIVSPSITLIDRVTKSQLYARYGVPYVWLVDQEGRIVDQVRPRSAPNFSGGCRPAVHVDRRSMLPSSDVHEYRRELRSGLYRLVATASEASGIGVSSWCGLTPRRSAAGGLPPSPCSPSGCTCCQMRSG
jgi:Putative restriction endonuclease